MSYPKKEKPKLINEFCSCGKQLNEYHLFFGRKKCSDCEPIYLLKHTNDTKQNVPAGRAGNKNSVDDRE